MIEPNKQDFYQDMEDLRSLGIIKGDSENNSLTVKFIDQLTDYMVENKEDFYTYDVTQPILNAVEHILLTNYKLEYDQVQRMILIITAWINMMLKNGGFYDLN